MTVSDTPPPLTDEGLQDLTSYVEMAEADFSPEWLKSRNIPSLRLLVDETSRLRVELAETRRVAVCNNVAFQKSVDELTAVNTALRADSMPRAEVAKAMDALTRAAGEAIAERDGARMERDALGAKINAVPTPVPDLVLTPEGFEFEGRPMKVMNLTTSDRGTEHVEASIRMVTMTEWRRRREAAGLPAALGETGGTE